MVLGLRLHAFGAHVLRLIVFKCKVRLEVGFLGLEFNVMKSVSFLCGELSNHML